jgi:RNA polymerase sigma-70 factor (ECF subfamily)
MNLPGGRPEGKSGLSDNLHELVDRCLAGEQFAMVQFVDRFQGQVFGLCYRMLGHRQDAEDMAQESFVRALRSLSQWDRARDLIPWLLAIAGNRCRSLLSVRGRRPKTTAIADQMAVATPGEDSARALGEEVQHALANLRPEYQQAFLLFHENELSYQDIAAAMDCPLGTIKTWVHRARREIIDQLRKREVLSGGAACSASNLKHA